MVFESNNLSSKLINDLCKSSVKTKVKPFYLVITKENIFIQKK